MIVVSQELAESLLNSINNELRTEVFQRIKNENPVLFESIKSVIEDDSKSEDFQDGFSRAAFIFYYLLQAQQEVDEMNEVWI